MNLLAKMERQARKEGKLAQKFIDQNGIGSLPGRRSETGESSGRQQIGHAGNAEDLGAQREADGLTRRHRDTVSYDSFGGVAAYEDWLLDNRRNYIPLVGGGQGLPSHEQLEKRSRMNHVFSFLQPRHVELLHWRHVEGMTLQQIADQEHVSRQAIHGRLKVAEREFVGAYMTHWADDVTWEEV